ncbi:INTEGRAL MEMBRANE PROTEIN (Rhomboid family) [hydrothermal vent metagenome]|uniref:INTEGRAL MEMBRANE PROTEIN (Rhomboid family) n=1 Tax=hydrothermal vent metagenome TaxID=652676 RepID=A0A3B0XNH8_9ZZZZ
MQTPEGVDIYLRLAGIWPRSVAWLIDSAIRIAVYIVLGLILDSLGDFGNGLLLISIFIIEWFYPVVFEVLNTGMTPGKKSIGIQVLNSDGTPIGWSASMLRNILRTVDFLPFFYGLGLLSMLSNKRFQRLGDLAADTLVVYYDNTSAFPEIPQHPPLKPGFELNLKEQQAIIYYAERSKQLSDERLDELADILDPLDVKQGDMTKEKLLGIANGLTGRQ